MSKLFTGVVAAPRLHVRSGPKVILASLRLLSKEDVVNVIDIDGTGAWGQVEFAKGELGWVSLKYVQHTQSHTQLLNIAAAEVGVKENPDPEIAHPRILQYLASVDDLDMRQRARDETPWCSCFINWCVEQAGLRGCNSAQATQWHDWHTTIARGDATAGDLAVFTRHSPSSSGGHVGFFVRYSDDGEQVLLVGGNQSNSVRYSWYPIAGASAGTEYQLISVRRA